MPIPERLGPELEIRAGMLAGEVAHWNSLADANQEGLGIHRSQLAAVRLLFEELLAGQNQRLTDLRAATTSDDFADKRMDLESELVGIHGIMAIFRYILAQRADPRHYRQALDAADLIAADCYRFCIGRAKQMGVLTEEQFREPPLTYLNSTLSPTAFTRRHLFGAFKLQPDELPELRLPVSVISLPFHHTVALWTYCSVYHEVGHPLEQDLGLLEALTPLLTAGLQSRQNIWSRWLREMIADTFAVLLGAVAYAHSLAQILFLPASEVTRLSLEDPHPTPYVRIFLVGALLRRAGVPEGAAVADQLEQQWVAVYGEAAPLKPLVDDCPVVARILLDTPLANALQGRRLRDFAAIEQDEAGQIQALARFLRTGLIRPDPAANPPFPYRLVPAAAQMAVQSVTTDHTENYGKIHERALQFIEAIPRPQFLGPPTLAPAGPSGFSPAREAHLRGLVRRLNLRSFEGR